MDIDSCHPCQVGMQQMPLQMSKAAKSRDWNKKWYLICEEMQGMSLAAGDRRMTKNPLRVMPAQEQVTLNVNVTGPADSVIRIRCVKYVTKWAMWPKTVTIIRNQGVRETSSLQGIHGADPWQGGNKGTVRHEHSTR